MDKDKLIEELKYLASIIGFITIIYPLKRFIIPFWTFLLNSSATLWAMGLIWICLYMYDYDITKFCQTFVDKLMREYGSEVVSFFIDPVVIVFGYEITWAHGILALLFMVFITRLYQVAKLGWVQLKRLFGDILIVLLWLYYRIRGQNENAVMLINRDELKNKLWMYIIIVVVLILSIAFVVLPNVMFAFATHTNVNTTAPLMLGNDSQ